jgi:hypothetical protein
MIYGGHNEHVETVEHYILVGEHIKVGCKMPLDMMNAQHSKRNFMNFSTFYEINEPSCLA